MSVTPDKRERTLSDNTELKQESKTGEITTTGKEEEDVFSSAERSVGVWCVGFYKLLLFIINYYYYYYYYRYYCYYYYSKVYNECMPGNCANCFR